MKYSVHLFAFTLLQSHVLSETLCSSVKTASFDIGHMLKVTVSSVTADG